MQCSHNFQLACATTAQSCNLQLAAHSLQQCIFFVGDVCVLLCQQPQILEKCCTTLPWHEHVRTLYGDVLSTWPVCTMTPRSWHLFPTYNFALGLQMSCHRISPTHDLDWHPMICKSCDVVKNKVSVLMTSLTCGCHFQLSAYISLLLDINKPVIYLLRR